jgi:transcription-repair coupling factor (superfamily II helicase)
VEIATAAAGIVERTRAREAARAPVITPPRAEFDRFVRRVPYTLTADQGTAIDAILRDLARGRPMDRLVCGDVAFGKTEVALHAAAAVALAGKQVAVLAPTTLLARQHLETFRSRFSGLGIAVDKLIRSARSAEGRAVTKGLADGSVRVVVGTHALAAPGLRFYDLGLVVIDEEQRFGEAQKRQLRGLGAGQHVLTMTATPLPRSLQAALVGLIDVSVLATPPVARQPVRGFVMPFDPVAVRGALLREARRGGQSFVVCPRIEDLAPMQARLTELVPELSLVVAHGRMRDDALDAAMLDFAEGRGDVLLATNIIEAGLDIPNANTMLVWRPDRFGLAQLHQLRGRVGRGRSRATAYLLTDPAQTLSGTARKRLETLAALDNPGAGFAISVADLDQRGAGDLLGDAQAGHVRLVGTELYRHLLTRALAAARGAAMPTEWAPEIALEVAAYIPADLVPEPDVRLEIYRRLGKLESVEEVDALGEELADRFGELPEPARSLLDIARLGLLCRALDIASLRAGPEAVAITPRQPDGLSGVINQLRGQVGTRQSGERLLLEITESRAETRLSILLDVLGDGSRRADRQHPARAATRKKMVRTSGLDSAPEVEPARAEGAQGS